jgi:glycosyltransferase involved in cell wall biosynthesis
MNTSPQRPLSFSIVTPSFNQAAFLGQTLFSVLTQDYPHLEYIVMDGGSTDDSADLIRAVADKLAYWCSEPDAGQADAVGKGFDRAQGDILGWLNSDDVLLPGALSKVADYFQQHPEVDAVSGGGYYIDVEGRPLTAGFDSYTLGVAATFDRLRFYEQDGIFQPATFWRRSAYEAVGGIDRSLQFILDRDLFTRLAQRRPFGRLPELLACFRMHEDCKSMRLQEVRRTETRAFARKFRLTDMHPLALRAQYWRFRIPSLVRKTALSWQRTTRPQPISRVA